MNTYFAAGSVHSDEKIDIYNDVSANRAWVILNKALDLFTWYVTFITKQQLLAPLCSTFSEHIMEGDEEFLWIHVSD